MGRLCYDGSGLVLVLTQYTPLLREHILKLDSLGELAPRNLDRSAFRRELASNVDRVARNMAHLMAPFYVVFSVNFL